MAGFSVEGLASSLVREFLSRKGLSATLAKMDEESPRTADSVSNRASLARAIHIERLLKRNKAREQPYRSMLEVLVAECVGRRGKDDAQTAPTHSSISESHAAHHHPHVHVTTQPEKESFSSLSSDYCVSSSSLTVDRSSAQSSVGVALHSLTFGASGTKNNTVGECGNGTGRSLRSNPAPRGATISSGGRSLKTQVYRKHSNPITSRTPLDLTAIPPPSSLDTPSPSDAPARRNPSSVEQREPSFPSTPERKEVKPQNVTPSADVGKKASVELVFEDLESLDLGMEPIEVNTAAVPTRPIPVFPSGHSIGIKTAKALRELLFGSAKAPSFSEEWRRQDFVFSDHPQLRYGLIQHKGGPCGVLACVQAHVLKHLMSPDRHKEEGASPSSPPQPSDAERVWALGESLADMLWRTGAEKSAIVVLPSSNFSAGLAAAPGYLSDGITERLVVRKFVSREVLLSFLHSELLRHPTACVLFLASAVLSRGIENIKTLDLDSQEDRLIGQHGYCTQEVVNLLLLGVAVPHVFDGMVELESGGGHKHVLKGVPHASDIGLLSLFEHYGSCKVGSCYKTPKLPIWVICSESHFSVLFSTNEHWNQAAKLDLYYFDGLARQDEEIQLSLETASLSPGDKQNTTTESAGLEPPLELCIKTRWSNVTIDWNKSTPIL